MTALKAPRPNEILGTSHTATTASGNVLHKRQLTLIPSNI